MVFPTGKDIDPIEDGIYLNWILQLMMQEHWSDYKQHLDYVIGIRPQRKQRLGNESGGDILRQIKCDRCGKLIERKKTVGTGKNKHEANVPWKVTIQEDMYPRGKGYEFECCDNCQKEILNLKHPAKEIKDC